MAVRLVDLEVLDDAVELLCALQTTLQRRTEADHGGMVPGNLRSPLAAGTQPGVLAIQVCVYRRVSICKTNAAHRPQTQRLAARLCGELAAAVAQLRAADARVAFLGRTGSGKSFVLDTHAALRRPNAVQRAAGLAQGARTAQLGGGARRGRGSASESAPHLPLARRPRGGPVARVSADALPYQDGARLRGAAVVRGRALKPPQTDVRPCWADELAAFAGFASAPAWPAGDQDAHEQHLDLWTRHNFLLRLSSGGTGTATFVEISHTPLFSATVRVKSPKELLKGLKDLLKHVKEQERAAAKGTGVGRADDALVREWRILSGHADGAACPSAAQLQRMMEYGKSYAKHLYGSAAPTAPPGWFLPDCLKAAMCDASHPQHCVLRLGAWDGPENPAGPDEARCLVRDQLSALLLPQPKGGLPGLGPLVKSAHIGVPFAAPAMADVTLLDVPGTSDANEGHRAQTRLAVERTKLAVLVLSPSAGGGVTLDADARDLARTPFVQSMLLNGGCSLVVLVNADKSCPPRLQSAAEADALRKALHRDVLAPAVALLRPKGGDPAASPSETELAARAAAMARELPVIYARVRTAAALLAADGNEKLLADYCADPGRFLDEEEEDEPPRPLPPPPPLTTDQLRAAVDDTGVARLVELSASPRAPCARASRLRFTAQWPPCAATRWPACPPRWRRRGMHCLLASPRSSTAPWSCRRISSPASAPGATTRCSCGGTRPASG